jgi:phosphatidylinositol alpha-1,6-mannosyltransferase
LLANARAAAWLIARSRADVWHFVFAPNPRSSDVGRLARRLRRIPVVQTIASAPRHFVPEVFFGDVVVAQSRWTRDRVLSAFRDAGRPPPPIVVIPPPVGPMRPRSSAQLEAVRRELSLPSSAPLFVYPGDLEVSSGANTVAAAVPLIAEALPEAIVIFACRPKTDQAPALERSLAVRLAGHRVRFTRTTDLPALLALASAVLFPVDDLFGKVDLPISLLEAMRTGVPVIGLNVGPLADLEGALKVAPGDHRALADTAVGLVRDGARRARVTSEALEAVRVLYDAPVVAAAYERVYDTVLGHGPPLRLRR